MYYEYKHLYFILRIFTRICTKNIYENFLLCYLNIGTFIFTRNVYYEVSIYKNTMNIWIGDKNSGSGEKIKHMGIIIADLEPFSHSRSNKCARARRERFWIQLIIDRRRCSQPDHVASWVLDVRMRTQGEESASGTFAWLGSLESPDGQLETNILIEIDE